MEPLRETEYSYLHFSSGKTGSQLSAAVPGSSDGIFHRALRSLK